MISISITAKAYRAIRAEGADLWPPQPFVGSDGLIRIWLDHAAVDRLRAARGPGESYSDAILRLAKEGSSARGPRAGRLALVRLNMSMVNGKQETLREVSYVEIRTFYWVGRATACHCSDDRVGHACSVAAEKRHQRPQRRPRPREMAELLARSLGKSSLQLVLARSLGTRSLRVIATLE